MWTSIIAQSMVATILGRLRKQSEETSDHIYAHFSHFNGKSAKKTVTHCEGHQHGLASSLTVSDQLEA